MLLKADPGADMVDRTAGDSKRTFAKIGKHKPPTGCNKMKSDLEKNKNNAQAFYDLMFNQCQAREAVDKYVGDVDIQYNTAVGDGKGAFVD